MPTFLLQARLSYKALFLWRSRFSYVSNVFLVPVLSVWLYWLVSEFARGDGGSHAIAIGVAACAIPTIAVGGLAQSAYYERVFGTLAYLFSARGTRFLIYVSRGVGHIPNTLLSAGAGLAAAGAIAEVSFDDVNWATLCVALLAISLASIAFALCISNACIVFRDWFTALAAAETLLISLTGVVIPQSELPPGLDRLGDVLPLTNGLVAVKQAFAGGSVSAAGGRILAEMAVAAAYLVAGYALFRWIEHRARVLGRYGEL